LKKNYVLLGGAGFVAPRHYRAIKETGGNLLAILDPSDSVGILDSYFPDCKYFSELERFIRYCVNQDIDYCVVCSPNHLHSTHCWLGMHIGASIICEKPLCLREHNLIDLRYVEDNTEHRIWNILQLRLSPLIERMQSVIEKENKVNVVYYAPRGDWYDYSWKSNISKSGSVIFNIGIHLVDLLLYLFGVDWNVIKWQNSKRRCIGYLEFGATKVSIELSIEKGKTPIRVFTINGQDFDLSENFGDLHTLSYQKILAGEGFGIEDVRPAVSLCEKLRGY